MPFFCLYKRAPEDGWEWIPSFWLTVIWKKWDGILHGYRRVKYNHRIPVQYKVDLNSQLFGYQEFYSLEGFWRILFCKILLGKCSFKDLMISLMVRLCTSHLKPQHPPPRAWWGHSLSVSVKASEVPGHRGKNTEWSPHLWVLSCTDQSPVCVEAAATVFLKSTCQTLKSISKRRECGHELHVRK